jgi:hypothetical protein
MVSGDTFRSVGRAIAEPTGGFAALDEADFADVPRRISRVYVTARQTIVDSPVSVRIANTPRRTRTL